MIVKCIRNCYDLEYAKIEYEPCTCTITHPNTPIRAVGKQERDGRRQGWREGGREEGRVGGSE